MGILLALLDSPLYALILRELRGVGFPVRNYWKVLPPAIFGLLIALVAAAATNDGGINPWNASVVVFQLAHVVSLMCIWILTPLWCARSLRTDLEAGSLEELAATPLRFEQILVAKFSVPVLVFGILLAVAFPMLAPYFGMFYTPAYAIAISGMIQIGALACASTIGFWAATRPVGRPVMLLIIFGAVLLVLALPWGICNAFRLGRVIMSAQPEPISFLSPWQLVQPWDHWRSAVIPSLYAVFLFVVSACLLRKSAIDCVKIQSSGFYRAVYAGFGSYANVERFLSPVARLLYFSSPFSSKSVIISLAVIGFTGGLLADVSLFPSLRGFASFYIDFLVVVVVVPAVIVLTQLDSRHAMSAEIRATLIRPREHNRGRLIANLLLLLPLVGALVVGREAAISFAWFNFGVIGASNNLWGMQSLTVTYLSLGILYCVVDAIDSSANRDDIGYSSRLYRGCVIPLQMEYLLTTLASRLWWNVETIRLVLFSGIALLLFLCVWIEEGKDHRSK